MTKQKRRKVRSRNKIPLVVHSELVMPNEILPWEMDLLPLLLEQVKELARTTDSLDERGLR